jgi:SynChlorMet cassette protein ScmD
MSDPCVYLANPVVVLREEFDDWAVLYNPDTAAALGINPVGVAVWKLLDGTRSTAALAEEVAKQFVDVPESAPEHVRDFLDDLSSKGFIGTREELAEE